MCLPYIGHSAGLLRRRNYRRRPAGNRNGGDQQCPLQCILISPLPVTGARITSYLVFGAEGMESRAKYQGYL
jgi:hypothetical protein